jgi:hypothetical protein
MNPSEIILYVASDAHRTMRAKFVEHQATGAVVHHDVPVFMGDDVVKWTRDWCRNGMLPETATT